MTDIQKFKFIPTYAVYEGASDFRIYGGKVDLSKYPNVIVNKYSGVTIVGEMPPLTLGKEYEVAGEYKNNPKFGGQYEVQYVSRDMPTDENDIVKFLTEVLTKNQAETLYAVYPNILELVVNGRADEVDLSKTKGIKEKAFIKIIDNIMDNFALVDIITKYGGYGITMTMLKRIAKRYKKQLDRLEEFLYNEPYKTLCGVAGIGFKKADAMILSFPKHLVKSENIIESEDRMISCIHYILTENENNGSTYLDIMELRNQCRELVPQAIGKFVDVMKEADNYGLHFDKNHKTVARKITYQAEEYIADFIADALNPSNKKEPEDVNYEEYRTLGNMSLTDEQISILPTVNENNLVLLSGVAGSGKSSTMLALVSMLKHLNKSYLLLTPTGKSSTVLATATNEEASTIHRGLGVKRGFNGNMEFEHNKYNKLLTDYIIVDEVSMVDVFLFQSLLEAVDVTKTKILLVQDPEQIPSVRCGNVSQVLLNNPHIPKVNLTKIFRYDEGGLYNVATKIRKGENFLKGLDISNIHTFGEAKDYSLLNLPQETIVSKVVDFYETMSKKHGIEDIALMTHHNKGDYGTVALNKLIQDRINPPLNSPHIVNGNRIFVKGDKVIQIKNNYQPNNLDNPDAENPFEVIPIYNGNTGIITEVNTEDKTLIVDFGFTKVEYTVSDLRELDLGYAISIHKMQGSSSKVTIVLTPDSHIFFIDRNLLYTALTRTEKTCYHFASKKLIASAVKKSANRERETFLPILLREKIENNYKN